MRFHFTRLPRSLAATAALTTALLSGCATMGTPPATVTDGVYTGPNSMTLYTFDKDTAGSGKSTCNGPCATNWPPLLASETDRDAGEFSIIMRDDGKKQWALKGKPLYYWVKDSKPGDKTGDGFNKVWQTAKP